MWYPPLYITKTNTFVSYILYMAPIGIIGYKGYLGSYLHQELTGLYPDGIRGYDRQHPPTDEELAKHDIVIYLGGLSGRVRCNDQLPTENYRENVYDLMTTAGKMKPGALLIYASTASLYEGYGATNPDENAYLNVQLYDDYAYSMYLREQNVKTLTHISTIGLRLGTVIGHAPNQRTDLVHFALVRKAVLTGIARVFGANQHRAILWIRDLKRAITAMITKYERTEHKPVCHKIYNMASFNCTIAKIANEVASITGCRTMFEGDDESMKYNIGFSMNTDKIQRDYDFKWDAINNRVIIKDLLSDVKRICVSPDYLKPCEMIVCRVCKGQNIRNVFHFGNQPHANHYLTNPNAVLPEYPLQLCLCIDCWHTQIPYTIPPAQMFSNYVYLCGTSNTMRKYFADFADKSIAECGGASTGNVLEIACNDGTLLDAYKARGWNTWGYDPAQNLWEISSKNGHNVTVGFWGVDPVPADYPEFDMIVAQNVTAHVPDPVAFMAQCRAVMSKRTTLYIQTSQCHMIEHGQFDTAYHEHMSFFTVHSMWVCAQKAGLELYDVEEMDVHGKSYLFKLRLPDPATAYAMDITTHAIYAYEKNIGLYDELLYYVYVEKIKNLKSWMLETIAKYGATMPVIGYGAAAKGMTILNYIGKIDMDGIVDDSTHKQGYYATNYAYPIVAPTELQSYTDKPLCVVVFAWNFIHEIMERAKTLREGCETYFVVPYPKKALYHMNAKGETHIVYEEVDTRYNAGSLDNTVVLFSHFYNEEILLTQWIRHHAPLFDCAVLINHHSTDASVEVIRREAPSTWNVVMSSSREFCALATDLEVASYENSFTEPHWRLALTTTEFLFTVGLRRRDNPVFQELEGCDAIQISSVSLVDNAENQALQRGLPFLQQKNAYYFKTDDGPDTEEDKYLNNHYNRFMHRIRNMTNPYVLGRHKFHYPAVQKHMFIMKCLFTPYPDFFSRKLQIRGKMSAMNVRERWGFQHMMVLDEMLAKYDGLKGKINASVASVEDQLAFFDRYMKRIKGWETTQLLYGVYCQLYDPHA